MLYLLFHLDSERFVMPAREVREVLPLVTLKPLPGAPTGVVGLLNYRGAVVPVLDVAQAVLGRPSVRRVSTRLLVVERPGTGADGELLALMVERATGTIALDPADFRPPGTMAAAVRHLGPIAPVAGGLIQQLNLAGLLSAGPGSTAAAAGGGPAEPVAPLRR